MKNILIVLICILNISLHADDIVLKKDRNFKLVSNIHLINDIAYKDNSYQAFIEIPAGTREKWEVNHNSGNLEWEFVNSKPRYVNYLGYPGNYGFIPQTLLDKNDGGDGDPLDIIVLGGATLRGSIQKVKILGAIKLLDSDEVDDKIIAIPLTKLNPFQDIDNLNDMILKYPSAIKIVRCWFEHYKGTQIVFKGYINQEDATKMIERAHTTWSKYKNDH